MIDLGAVTLGQVSSALRDLTVVGTLLMVAWKTRGIYDSAKSFFERLTAHMDVMERGMTTLLSNHLTHIEADLKTISGRKNQNSPTES
jgi:hypothetical protein